jgi:DNA transposition AAA+ family ATPase
MNSTAEETNFVQTLEYRRFAEFCDACRTYRYIGLCYGPPGVGKTLSARHFARWDALEGVDGYALSDDALHALVSEGVPDTLFYTPSVTNSPRSIADEISEGRSRLQRLAREPLKRQERAALAEQSRHAAQEEVLVELDQIFAWREKAIADPTTLVLLDEADRLKMASLEATRDLFDRSSIGLVLIGMPGIEKRLARYPQFYSRVGFVHEFRPLGAGEVRRLLEAAWAPPGVQLPPLEEESIAAVIRITGGNFRLLHRLLAQTERIARINQLGRVTRPVVEAARESLVIGSSG